jgi:arthrofactin-type cyclic lipopeptide synthetase C
MFINTLPLRVEIGEAGAAASVRRVHALLAELLRHEHASLALAQRCSAVPAPAPLFSALLNYRHSGRGGAQAGEAWQGIELLSGKERNNYPVTLAVDDLIEEFRITVRTQPSVGAERLCGFMRTALEGLAEALERTPEKKVCRIDVLPGAERHRVVEDWNATSAEYPQEQCIHELFEAQVGRMPDAVAVVHEDRELSYGELNVRSNRLAHHLRRLGVKPDDRVAICVERSVEMVVGLLAVLKAGGAYVPLDPSYPPERLGYMLADSAPIAVLTDAGSRGVLAGHTGSLPVIDLGEEALWADQPDSNPDRSDIGLTPEHLAYVIYTSGSTGRPKGVLVEHRQVVTYIWALAAEAGLDRVSTYMMVQPLTVDSSVTVLYASLLRGGALHVMGYEASLDAERLAAYGLRHGIDCLKIAPPHLQSLMEVAGSREGLLPRKVLIVGGDVSRWDWMDRVRAAAPGCRIFNHYGPTETTVGVTVHRADIAGERGTTGNVPIGRPLGNTRAYILDEQLTPVPIGVVGDLYIGGSQVARGYLGRADLTCASFIADPFSADGSRLYRTGDRARFLADGTIEFLGRADEQIKLRGYRIEPEEISSALLEHAGVRQAVTVPYGSGGAEKILVAYAVLQSGAQVMAADLRHHLTARLPAHMVPSAVVLLDTLPLTPHGKLDRKALPAPEGDAYAVRAYEAPRGEVEEKLAAIWCELLRVERVGRHDNFFELGGHSLLAVQLTSVIKRSGMNMSLAQLFIHPTIETLARSVSAQESVLHRLGLVPLRTEGGELPLFVVHPIWGEVTPWGERLTRHIDAAIPVYGLVAEVPSEAKLRTMQGMAARLVRAIRAVQPVGPYRIAGWSFGARLAYEIASQLIGDEERVEFLGLIEGLPGREARGEEAQRQITDDQILRSLVLRRNPSPAVAQELNAVAPGDLAALWRKCQQLSLVPERLAASSLTDLQQLISRRRLLGLADMDYEPDPISILIHLFVTPSNQLALAQHSQSDDVSLGRKGDLQLEQQSIVQVPGEHESMMEEPHVASLGAELSHRIRQASRKPPAPDVGMDSLLVPIRRAQRNRGAVICVPGAGGNAAGFNGLADALGDDWETYGMQPRGLDGNVPHSTVSAAARAYIRSLEENCPEGPVHLVGHSFGGWVTFEMARRLQAVGRPPESLTLIDSSAPLDQHGQGREYTRLEVLMKMVGIWEMAAERPLGISQQALEACETAEDRLLMLHGRLVSVGLMPLRSRPDALTGPIRAFAAAVRCGFRPKALYPEPVNLILLADSRLDDEAQRHRSEEITAGWRCWAPKLEVWRGPGNHMTALKSPNVRIVGDWLRAKLKAATPQVP